MSVTRHFQQPASSGFVDVRAHGAKGDGSSEDGAAIQAAIDAVHAGGGGVVWFPTGRYNIRNTLVVPVVLNQTIVLRGEGMRSTYVYPITNGMTAIRFGAEVADDSGSNSNKTQYCGMEDLSVNGSLMTAGTGIGVQFSQMQKGWLRDVIIEGFQLGASIGLHLRGSHTTHGLGAAAAPHTWRCTFDNVVVAQTIRPLLIENGDENDFFGCNFGLPRGVSAAPDSLAAIEIRQGHNNRFWGVLASGETDPSHRSAYIGLRFTTPQNGDNLGHQVYGLVAEGFNYGVWVDPDVRDIWIRGYDSSINAHAFWNGSSDGEVNRQRQNNLNVEMVSDEVYYRTRRSDWPETVTFSDGNTTPSVRGSDAYAFSNSKPTGVTNFLNGRDGQLIFVRLDENTTMVPGKGLRLPGGKAVVGTPHAMASFAFIGDTWELVSLSRNA